MTLYEALAIGTNAIGRHEARILLSHITELSPTDIMVKPNQPLDETTKGAFFAAMDRRMAKEPLQYIIGEWEFMGLAMKIDRRALIPRPETELLVEEALMHIGKLGHPAKVLDVCTGSGCISVAIAKLSDATVTAIDISPDALALAVENAEFHGLTDKIRFIQGDLLNKLEDQTFDVIISNPPYIPTFDLMGLQPEIDHEPKLALDGGGDGMEIYRRLVPQTLGYLAPSGKLLLEIGPTAVETIMIDVGYDIVKRIKDYAGHSRVLVGAKYIGGN
ncbi:MAG: peptide chain release factor N(5)-glutamine methyltransferase [Defluviitaleaceae bacterium]|nr:peptide chain release factor N(5)-glutamine methyltransferase [Defluviitaleaceae bacterium]